ncbi:HD domain-containing protein [Rickettsia helvetica]|uniref:HD domain-containing protein n=1 Tax=Rickettsia helvetica TaxID=35789 RepID=A0ABP0T6C1_RICHE|nr:HD domain-containing protein [Rickettsia helvetica]MCZ6884005.1 HD domain-containing protein [Rickettsia endosymbiont of Ixodes ricinus]MCZ6896634.1 HD domain-containing protein [Rickettsia endosymbiont of Ixodes ricinus]
MEDLSSWKEKFEICVYSKKLLDKLEYLNTKVENPIDILEIKKGIYYARKYHGSQMRQSGDPYYSHPIEVAIMLAEFVAEEAPKLHNVIMLQAALLHDTIEDTELTEEAITEIFGPEVAKHIEDLTRIKSYGKISSGESLNLLIKEKRYNMALIKLFDRIHNVQTLGVKSPEKARKIIEETLINFLLVAANINYKLEQEFAELCLKVFNIELERQKAFSNNNSKF